MFQSLFYWMLLSNSEEEYAALQDWLFQSLFYWMLLSNGDTRKISADVYIDEFQSLFYWMLLSNLVTLPQVSHLKV